MDKNFTNDTSISIADALVDSHNATRKKVFECNVNMRVSLSNNKRSKIFQRAQSLLIIFLAVTFVIVFSQLKRDLRSLEEQIHSMNSNLVVLMLRYEKLNRNLNRMNFRRFRSSFEELPERTSIIPYSSNDDPRDTMKKLRYERSIITIDSNNVTDVSALSDNNTWMSERSGRSKREEVRGKQRRKMKRRPKRSRRRLGPLTATFVGGVPEQHITDSVHIGPWVRRNETRYGFNKFHLVEDKRSIEVTTNGLFMISAQIYYIGQTTHYSFWILISSEGSSLTRKIVKCATASAASATEASCFTSVIVPLRRGDRLHIQQQERNRLINLREGYSYVQVTLLSNDQPKRRLTI